MTTDKSKEKNEAMREKASGGWDTFSKIIPIILLLIIFGIAALHFSGIIDIAGLLNPNSENYIFGNDDQLEPKCFKYSTEMDTPCCTVKDGVRVSAVYAFKPQCQCPLDTVDYQYDVVLGNREYRTCDCQCPGSE